MEVDRRCFPDDEPVTFPGRSTEWWVAEDLNGRIVAFAAIKIKKATGELIRAGVLPQHRGNGLQRRLIDARIESAAAHGLQSVTTYTVTDNPASANNLIAAGFRMIKRPPRFKSLPGTCFWNINL